LEVFGSLGSKNTGEIEYRNSTWKPHWKLNSTQKKFSLWPSSPSTLARANLKSLGDLVCSLSEFSNPSVRVFLSSKGLAYGKHPSSAEKLRPNLCVYVADGISPRQYSCYEDEVLLNLTLSRDPRDKFSAREGNELVFRSKLGFLCQ